MNAVNELQSGPDLRDAIVQFRHPVHNGLVGAGFVVGGRWILTCAHVVVSAGGESGSSLEVIFHSTGEKRSGTVLPEAWQAPEGNDIAVLQLVGPKVQSSFQPRLGESSGCAGHRFRAFGFAPLGQVEGVWASGEIKGRVREDNSRELLQLASAELDQGLSGSPVFDITRGYVVGMVTMVNYPNASGKHRDTALATPAEALYRAFPALGLQAMPLRELLQVEGQRQLAHLFSRPVLAGITSRLQRWQAQRPLQAALAALSVLALVVLSTWGGRAYLNREWVSISGGQALLLGGAGQTCHVPVEPFQVQITEVTNVAYLACVRSGQCQPPNSIWEAGPQGPIYPDGLAEHPVYGVSWADAKSYCQFSGGRLP
ncbi:MAG: trypsin-like peptidase domain-containing protein, partial [Chloroflexota bacterium]